VDVDAVDLNLDDAQLIPHPKVTYHQTDYLEWKTDKQYDLVCAFEIYEHISPSQRDQFLCKILSSLRPGGLLLFSGPNRLSALYGAGYLKGVGKTTVGRTDEIDWHYRIPYTHYNKILLEHGFQVIRWETNGFLPCLVDSSESLLSASRLSTILFWDLRLSKRFPGLGANYFSLSRKEV
jgi:SAM-dependent methyltransferase